MTVLSKAQVEDLKLQIADAPTMESFTAGDWGTWGYDDEGTTAINNVWNLIDTFEAADSTIIAKDATIAAKDVIIAEKDVEISSLETDNATLTADNALLTAEVAKLELIAYGDPRVQSQYQARRPVTALNDTRTNRADGSQFWGPLET